MAKKESAEKAVRDIRRKTRRRFSAEEKIRGFAGGGAFRTRPRSVRVSTYDRDPGRRRGATPHTRAP